MSVHDRCLADDAIESNEFQNSIEVTTREIDECCIDEELLSNFFESFEVVVDSNLGKVRVYHRTIRLRDEDESHLEDDDNDENDTTDEGCGFDSKGIAVRDERNDEIEDTFIDSILLGCVGCGTNGLVPRSEVKSILKSNKYTGTNRADKPLKKDSNPVSMTRSVSFSSIEIKEFKMTLGDHPSAVSGPPVRLDWNAKPMIESVVSLDEFEQMRKPLRRKRKQLKLTNHQRKEILLNEQGFTADEVNNAWKEALQIRQQRYETLQRGVSPYQIQIDHLIESFHRKCDRLAHSAALQTSLSW